MASGIGITPALSVIREHKDSRRINLIWACRDPAMLEFFLEHLYLDNTGWNLIFYTGKEPLNPAIEELNTNIKVMKCRPSFPDIIPNIIHGIESETVLPEDSIMEQDSIPGDKCQVLQVLLGKLSNLDKSNKTDDEKVKELTRSAHLLGYQFTDLLSNLKGVGGDSNPDKDTLELSSTSESGSPTSSGINTNNLDKHEMLTSIRRFGKSHTSMSAENFAKNKDEVNNQRLAKRTSTRVLASRPWEKNSTASEYVKRLSKKSVLSTWGILYCGGSRAVEETLEGISKEYQIKLNSESFAW